MTISIKYYSDSTLLAIVTVVNGLNQTKNQGIYWNIAVPRKARNEVGGWNEFTLKVKNWF